MKRKRKETKEWHRQDVILKSLKKPKAAKRRMILVEETKDLVLIASLNLRS